MKVLGIVPARGGSKGIPNKNKALFCGDPLIVHTLKVAIASQLDSVIVSSDDPDILNIAETLGVATHLRSDALAQDDTPTLPVLQDVLASAHGTYDAVMTLQPTSPLRTTEHINESLALFAAQPEADSLVSIVKVPHNMTPDCLMVKNETFVSPTLDASATRRQDKPDFWARNGAAIYITKTDLLASSILGSSILGYEMSMLDSIDIDTPDDFKLAELLFSQRK